MGTQAIAYPFSFLDRPEDRLLLESLAGRGVSLDKARLILYRIWADFATGGSDRREVGSDPVSSSDRHVRLLEIFCEWVGASGALVSDALESGFLEIRNEDGKSWLVCKDFFPINSAWSAGGKQDKRNGAYARAAKLQQSRAQEDAAAHLELLTRSGKLSEAISGDRSKAALIFIHRIVRALKLSRLDSSAVTDRLLVMADAIVSSTQEPEIRKTLMWLISRRRNPDLPKEVAAVLLAWADLSQTSRREMP